MNDKPQDDNPELIDIELRDPVVAGVSLALAGSGAFLSGTLPQGNAVHAMYSGAFFFGLVLGDGKVVYASWKGPDFRWQYVFQLGVGLPALPALVQQQRVSRGNLPFFVTGYRDLHSPSLELIEGEPLPGQNVAPEAPMSPPTYNSDLYQDVLAKWHEESGVNFEMGTLYTVLAGLLNVLAIYDAMCGPLQAVPEEEEGKPDEDKKEKTE